MPGAREAKCEQSNSLALGPLHAWRAPPTAAVHWRLYLDSHSKRRSSLPNLGPAVHKGAAAAIAALTKGAVRVDGHNAACLVDKGVHVEFRRQEGGRLIRYPHARPR